MNILEFIDYFYFMYDNKNWQEIIEFESNYLCQIESFEFTFKYWCYEVLIRKPIYLNLN